MLKQELFNVLTMGPPILLLLNKTNLSSFSFDFYTLPSYSTHMIQLAFCYMLADFWFYWMHRLVHTKRFYWIHKKHHECKNTVVLASLNVHPIEFLIVDMVVIIGGPFILGNNIHFATVIAWMTWQILSNLDDHSGYELPWMFTKVIPFSATNTWHNYHHLLNIGNYAAHMVLWDSIFGTCIEYQDHFDEQEKKKGENEITRIEASSVGKVKTE